MPLPSAIKLFIDPRLGSAFGNYSGTSSLTNPIFTLGDTATIEVYLVESTGLNSYPRQEVGFPTSPGIRIAIGDIDQPPLAGTWTISYGGNSTTPLAFNATPAVVQTALNLLASITAAGGVTVSKIGDNYNILFNSVGARTELTTDGSSLIPLSAATIANLQAGSSTKPAIFLCHLQRTVAGLATSFSPTAQSQITVTSLTAWDNTKASYRVSISPDPKGGSFSLHFDALSGTDTSTAAINVGASALDVQNALSFGALIDDNVSVTQVGAFAYDITVKVQPGTNGLQADGAGLLSFTGYKGDLSLNTVEAVSLIDGADSVASTLEVEITSDNKRLTVLQLPCILKNAVIDEGALEPLVLDTYLSQTSADGKYFKLNQNLADGTAGTIRTNINVYSTSEVDTALALKADDSDLALKANLFEPIFSGKIQTPTIKNILNADLVIDSYNDTGAGTHYLHKFTPFDGKFVLATNGGGLTFGDGTTQTTAFTGVAATTWGTITGTLASQTDLSNSLADKANLAGAAFTGNVTSTGRMAIGGGLANNAAHKLAIYDGNIVFSTGFGLAFGDGTTQTTAASSPDLSGYALKSGATFTGKLNTIAPTSTDAGLNIGSINSQVNLTNSVAGDMWLGTWQLCYKTNNGTLIYGAATNATNVFGSPQVIDTTHNTNPALRITQKGAGNALVVEDSTTPDGTPFVINQYGWVGVGCVPGAAGITLDGVASGAVMYLKNGSALNLDSTAYIQFGFSTRTLSDCNYQSNGITSGNFSHTDYPEEVLLRIDGVRYAMPARIIP